MQYQSLPNTIDKLADILILPFAYEKTVSSKLGTKYAPKEILNSTSQIEYYDEDLKWSPMKYTTVCILDEINKFKDVKPLIQSLELSCDKLLITLGGEHSITPMITKNLLKNNSTIIFLDAHADLRPSYLNEKYSHASSAFHLLSQGHKLIMAGVRSLYEDEAQTIEENKNIIFFSDRSLQKEDKKNKFLNVLSTLKGTVYLSIDMDVFNPSYVPSVGTPQPGGIDWYYATDILEAIFTNQNITVEGVDLVELIPEPSEVSQTFAAKLLQKIISYWAKSKMLDKGSMTGSQMQVKYE